MRPPRRILLVRHPTDPELAAVVAEDGDDLPDHLITFADAAKLVGVEQPDIEDAIIDDGLQYYDLTEGVCLRVDPIDVRRHFLRSV